MAISDNPDPVVVEADERVERAKASLRARIAVIERRFGDVRKRLDVPEQVRRHPWPAIGISLALGALVGVRGERGGGGAVTRAPSGGHTLGSLAMAGLTAIGLRVARELIVAQIGRAARQWWLDHGDDLRTDPRTDLRGQRDDDDLNEVIDDLRDEPRGGPGMLRSRP
jgi:hypothetical protein